MAKVKCVSCGETVSSLAILCPECGGAVHAKSGGVPWPAVLFCGVVAGVAWFAIDRAIPPQPTSEHFKQLDEQIEQTKQLLDQSAEQMKQAQQEMQKQARKRN